MTRLERKEEEIGARLKSYASGNGALSFVYSDRHGRATSDAVTVKAGSDAEGVLMPIRSDCDKVNAETVKAIQARGDKMVEVKHISMKASVRFWLDNEKRCTELQNQEKQ